MSPLLRRNQMIAWAFVLSCFACTDRTPTNSIPAPGSELVAAVHCTVHVEGRTAVCQATSPASASAGGPSLALLSTDDVKLRATNVASDTLSQIVSFDVTAQNRLRYTIGTPDDETITGLKVFFETAPVATEYASATDSARVSVRNPDGYQNFTGPRQPYYHYNTILRRNATTAPKRWEFHVPRGVKSFGFTVRVFTATTQEQPVPAVAPNHQPAWFSDPAFHLRMGNTQTWVVKNVVEVNFRSGSSREERQSAVDVVNGSVVGGGGGLYYVRIPADGTLRSLEGYVQRFEQLPQVQWASVFIIAGGVEVSHLQPYDTTGWREWQLHPDSADDQNWALERIAAPYAWGCSCGDSSTRVAVLDVGFHPQPDLVRNLDIANSAGWNVYAGADTIDHGTRVASFLTARGNDSSQVTGTMWRSRLLVFDVATNNSGAAAGGGINFQRVWSHLRTAGRRGARVINLSLGPAWRDSLGNFRNPVTELDTAQRRRDSSSVNSYRRNLELSLDSVVSEGHDPLIVAAAGNNGIDARWSGFVTPVHGNRVLIVGASNFTDGLASFSNNGTSVEIAAPGQALHALWGNGQVDSVRTLPSGSKRRASGTSFAAPLVSGVGGLLFSFDPRLRAAEVKDLIVDGAVRGNRLAGGIPILNARESLIVAGRRAGAPLCGNRLWMLNGTMYAQRDTAASTGEPIFSVGGSPSPYGFNALHGGKLVHVSGGGGNHMMQWAGGTWSNGPLPGSGLPAGSNGSYLSRLPASHDGDSTLSVRSTRTAGTVEFRFRLSTGAGTQALPGMITAPYDDGTALCIREFVSVPSAEADALSNSPYTDVQTAYQDFLQRVAANPCLTPGDPAGNHFSTARAAYSPRGDVAYIFVTQRVGTTAAGGWAPCQTRELISHGNYRYELPLNTNCRGTTTTAVSAGTQIYRLSLAGGGISGPIGWGEPQAELMNAAIREDGKEMVVDRRMLTTVTTVQWLPGAAFPRRTDSPQALTCALQYRDVSTGSSALGVNNGCRQTLGEGGFAASRSADGSIP